MSSLNMVGTKTGRWSSSAPNLSNLPRKASKNLEFVRLEAGDNFVRLLPTEFMPPAEIDQHFLGGERALGFVCVGEHCLACRAFFV